MISILTLVFNPFSENTFILYDETGECIIIDPGCYEEEEEHHLIKVIERENLKPVALLNTHCHIDHVLGNAFAKEVFGIELQIPKDDEETYNAVTSYASSYGFPAYKHTPVDVLINPNKVIKFGNSSVKALYVPGHTRGHLAFVCSDNKICIGGDVLFDGSIGRTDLPGGDFNTLIESIHKVLFALPDDMVVYPGHGPATTIGKEKKSNPFCAVK